MELISQLFNFIEKSPTACHTAASAKEMLLAQGFQELSETEPWDLTEGGKYFTLRAMSSLVAFRFPKKDFQAFSIVAPHGDSPCFKVKDCPELSVDGRYTRLNTEVYGGTQLALWTDRPLSAAGRLLARTPEGVQAFLVNIDRDLLLIPGLAIHMNRDVNQGVKLDPQKDTLPLLGGPEADLVALAAEQAGVKKEDVLSWDLFLYHRAKGTVFGAQEEFIAAPRLDDLECVFSALKAFLASENPENVTMCAVFDNEETGSLTRQGADSTFLSDVISRICLSAGKNREEELRAIAKGFLLSADNAHAVHPNLPEKADLTNRCYLNGGVVIKHSTRYATDSITAAIFQSICEKAGVPTQTYYNHSGQPGGGTLGNLSGSHVSIPTADIGLAQLSMHSPLETAGKEDLAHMVKAMSAFYRSQIFHKENGNFEICSREPANPGKEPGSPEKEQTASEVSAKPEAPVKPEAPPEAAAQTAPEPQAAAPAPAKPEAQAKPAVPTEPEKEPKATPFQRLPGWAEKAVFYQIYPMGFCGAPFENDGVAKNRIEKVKEWIPHLQKLGIGAVYFSPVFESDTHGYDTRDYTKIDRRLGSNQDFQSLCEALHKAGIAVVLDGVFNHVGRGFWAFQDVLKNRESSPYKDWFFLNFGGDNGYHDGLWYEGWEGHFELVKLNLKNPQVVDHLLSCVEGWMREFAIDGLRLDVAYSLDENFMRRLHSFCKEKDPSFFLVGEMIHGDYKRIVNPDMLDSATNYECYKGLYSSFNSLNMFEIAHSLARQFGPENWTLYRGMHLLCFADNHDVTRIHSILTDKSQLAPLYAVLFCMPGIPCLYYGSEWGADGEKSQGDPALRPCFEAPTENELTRFLGRLSRVKQESPALCYGDFQNETLLNKQWVMRRSCPEETVLMAVNAEGANFNIGCRHHGKATELLTGEEVQLQGTISLKPYDVKIYRLEA